MIIDTGTSKDDMVIFKSSNHVIHILILAARTEASVHSQIHILILAARTEASVHGQIHIPILAPRTPACGHSQIQTLIRTAHTPASAHTRIHTRIHLRPPAFFHIQSHIRVEVVDTPAFCHTQFQIRKQFEACPHIHHLRVAAWVGRSCCTHFEAPPHRRQPAPRRRRSWGDHNRSSHRKLWRKGSMSPRKAAEGVHIATECRNHHRMAWDRTRRIRRRPRLPSSSKASSQL
ncbi:hypothetical protein SLEP1_g20350 [Rubroshorea leprosula]|uniref:Uncharacterized protein n=1 Tax=Rubroshorea leprosula TaxID=152421 RepID=A0AAV5JBE1_9ROSI|nr:hypothetical protein SLEP1_g20350 [Rubroshorea leprosula]